MLFINMALAAGVAAIAIPIVIHLLNRRTAKLVDWGAMRFLLESITHRRRRIRLEEALLMAARCLVLGLLALALARPFIPPGSNVPWMVVLPLALLAIVGFGVAVALWSSRRWRWILLGGSALATLLCVGAIAFERHFNLKRFNAGERQDIAIVIDGSSSMTIEVDGETNFARAVAEARDIIERSGGGDAFSVVVGGPVPSAKFASPVTNRADLLETLDALEPLFGAMAAYDTVNLAAVGLAHGSNPNKQIIFFTDGQNVGWETDNPARWEFLREGLESLPTAPQLIIRTLPAPRTIRNASVAAVNYSRPIVGTDRPVTVEVTIENTGTEAVTPSAVELSVGGATLREETVGQLLPGTQEVARFEHRFADPGGWPLEARVVVADDIASDNTLPSAIEVVGQLRVLIVDGSPASSFFDRASAFTALALAPGALEAATAAQSPEDVGGEPRRFLVEPEVVMAPAIGTIPSFSPYSVVILADVARLPADTAAALAWFVKAGGGLLIAPGERAQPAFYNRWSTDTGQPVLPAPLIERVVAPNSEEPESLVLTSFSHPALADVSDPKQSDLGGAAVHHYWKLGVENPDADVTVGARLAGGDAFLAERRLGQGSAVLLAAPLDNRSGSLVTRQAFVPLMHELVYYLSNPRGTSLNLEPAWELSVDLSGSISARGAGLAGHGLLGRYFKDRDFGALAVTRVDPVIDFNWGGGSPAPDVPSDRFSVRWTGSITPSFSEEYEITAEADDRAKVTIGGEEIIGGGRAGRIRMEADQRRPIQISYDEGGGNASIRLFWKSDSQPWEIIPSSAFLPIGAEGGAGEQIDSFAVRAPDGSRRTAAVFLSGDGMSARIDGDVIPGLYHIEIPEERRGDYQFMLSEDGTIPFTVVRDPAESRLERLAPEDISFIGSYVDVLQPDSVSETLQILAGKEFGEELWKFLAVGALAVLLAEVILARWISKNRGADDKVEVKFEPTSEPSAAFRDQLERIRRVEAAR